MARTYGKAQDLIDFTRSSGGTALRRVKYGAELVDTANDAPAWSAYGSNTVVQDGDAVKATYVDSASGAYIYLIPSQGTSQQLEIGTLYTLTANAKVNSGSVSVEVYDGSSPNQVAVSSTSYIDIQINFVANGLNPYIRLANMGSGEIIWIKNISIKEVTFDTSDGDLILFNHPNNIPRIEYDADGNLLGLLVEESRTNKITYSEDFGNSYWGKIDVTLSAASVKAPDGSYTATKVAVSGANPHMVRQSVASSGDCKSIWARTVSGTGTVALLALFASGDKIVTLTEEWQRFDILYDDETGAVPNFFYAVDFRGSSTLTEAIIWGAQVEAGSFPTSYIPTSGSTATRSADVASLSTSAFGYNQDEGTMIVEGSRPYLMSNSKAYFSISDGASTNRFTLYIQGNTQHVNGYVTPGPLTLSDNIVANIGGFDKWAMTIEQGHYTYSVNGAIAADVDSSSGTFSGKTIVHIGNAYTNSPEFACGHIKSIKYLPRRVTNAQLQELTS